MTKREDVPENIVSWEVSAKYYLVNFNLIVSKVNFFSWWEDEDQWALIRARHLFFTYLIGWAVIRG